MFSPLSNDVEYTEIYAFKHSKNEPHGPHVRTYEAPFYYKISIFDIINSIF